MKYFPSISDTRGETEEPHDAFGIPCNGCGSHFVLVIADPEYELKVSSMPLELVFAPFGSTVRQVDPEEMPEFGETFKGQATEMAFSVACPECPASNLFPVAADGGVLVPFEKAQEGRSELPARVLQFVESPKEEWEVVDRPRSAR